MLLSKRAAGDHKKLFEGNVPPNNVDRFQNVITLIILEPLSTPAVGKVKLKRLNAIYTF